MSRVGLVTVLFNCHEVLAEFFEGLARQDFNDYKLFIVDNSTNDVSYIEASNLVDYYHMKERTVFIKNDSNLGVAKANNQGIEKSILDGSEFTLLLNNDITWESDDVISALVKYAEDSNVDMIVPKILFHDTRRIWAAGGYFDVVKGITRHKGENEVDRGQYASQMKIDYAPTCFMLIKNQVFNSVGMMDERFFVYYDDTDFVWRAKNSGVTLFYYPDVTICHKVSSSTGGQLSPFSVYQSTRNRLLFIRKHYNYPLFLVSFLYFFLGRLVKFDILKNITLRKSMIRGVLDGLRFKL